MLNISATQIAAGALCSSGGNVPTGGQTPQVQLDEDPRLAPCPALALLCVKAAMHRRMCAGA
jgi:hypothetical protein